MADSRVVRTGPGRPAGSDSFDTRQRVIEAACRCFAQHGYGAATNNVIAEMAGVTAGSVYYHFGAKRKLFEAVCEYVYGNIVTRSRIAMAGAHTVPELLRAILMESIRINHESPELAGFVAAAPVDARRHADLTEIFAEKTEGMRASLAEAVRAGQEGGHIPADADPLLVAGMISAVVDGFANAAASVDANALDAMTQLFDALVLTGAGGG